MVNARKTPLGGFDAIDWMDQAPSSGRQKTHEIDALFGSAHASSGTYPRVTMPDVARRPAHVPTLPAPTPLLRARPARRAVMSWDFDEAADLPSSSLSGALLDLAREALDHGLADDDGAIEILDQAPALADDELEAILGGTDRVLRRVGRAADIVRLGLEPREAFMLALVDGASTVEELADISGFGRSAALQVLVALQRGGALR
jgi:hypothetical protein